MHRRSLHPNRIYPAINGLDPTIIRDRFLSGEFQFYPVINASLPEDCTGETLIPRSYVETHYRPYLVSFEEDVPDFQQSVVVLSNRAS
jgi:hypothetical protein